MAERPRFQSLKIEESTQAQRDEHIKQQLSEMLQLISEKGPESIAAFCVGIEFKDGHTYIGAGGPPPIISSLNVRCMLEVSHALDE